MSKYAPWKEAERRHAKRMGGVRLWRPDFSDSQPDGETDADTWDTKVRKGVSAIALFVECEKKYREFTGKRRFHLMFYDTTRPRAGDFVLCRAEDFAELVAAADVGRGLVEAFTEHVEGTPA